MLLPNLLDAEFKFFFPVDWDFELRASCLQSRHSAALATRPVHFVLVIMEMGSRKLFAQAGIKAQSS
jgi:hypothetical protein